MAMDLVIGSFAADFGTDGGFSFALASFRSLSFFREDLVLRCCRRSTSIKSLHPSGSRYREGNGVASEDSSSIAERFEVDLQHNDPTKHLQFFHNSAFGGAKV